jgi:peptidyl-prolyl cis-trans isomerase A (cyclophilin A)
MHRPTPITRRLLSASAGVALLATLAACGGGGSNTPATVMSASASATRYGAAALLTINGTGLDNISVASPGCKGITRLTTAPTVSTSTTAYYGCTVSGAYTSSFTITSNGTAVGTAPFTVPAPVVTMTVNNGQGVNGNIVISLAGDKAPITVDNFLAYVNSGFYNNTIFHRVVANFVAQGGGYGPAPNGVLGSPKATNAGVPLEIVAGLSNVTWSIAMANTGQPNSTTSQFFINLANNATKLDGYYSVFGSVTAGTDVVTAIVAAPAQCTENPLANTNDCLPLPNVVVTQALQTQ